jgi:hypothetical protein
MSVEIVLVLEELVGNYPKQIQHSETVQTHNRR